MQPRPGSQKGAQSAPFASCAEGTTGVGLVRHADGIFSAAKRGDRDMWDKYKSKYNSKYNGLRKYTRQHGKSNRHQKSTI